MLRLLLKSRVGTADSRGMELSLVLPCYDEAEHIDRSVPRLIGFLDAMGLAYELVFVDDASRDDTRQRLARIAQRRHITAAP